jgi:hypothetical protein
MSCDNKLHMRNCYEVITLAIIYSKGKVVPLLFLTEHHAMKAYWESGSIALRIL